MKKFLLFLVCSLQLMSANIDWSFPPTAISTSGQTAETPAIAIDPNGNVVSVWVVSGLVKAKVKLVNMSWSSEVTISGSGSSSPSVVIDANGNSTAVWLEGSLVKAASKTLNGSWSSASTLSSSGASSPTLALDAAGDVIAAWVRSGDVQTTTKLFGGSWQTAVSINLTAAARPHVAIGGSGANTRAVIVFEDVVSGVNIVYGASKLISTSAWGAKQQISDSNHQAGYARAAVDANGNATAVWFCYDVTGINYYRVLVESSYRPAAATWGSFCVLSEAGIGNPANLTLRVRYDASGNAVALWNTTFDNETYSIQSAVKNAYRSWSDAQTLVENNLYALNAGCALTDSGDAVALFMFYDGADLMIQSSELDITGFSAEPWSLPQTLSDGAQNARPAIAASVSGNVIYTAAVWLGVNGMSNAALASVGTKAILAPPTSLAVSQSSHNFSVFTEYYNTLSWTASTDPKVTGYLVYRNGVFLEQVSSDVLSIVDDNRVQSGAVSYGVAAVDNQNNHSRIITVTYP